MIEGFMRRVSCILIFGMSVWTSTTPARAGEDGREPAERGRVALTSTGYLRPSWSDGAYKAVGKLWGGVAVDPDREPEAYASAFNRRYGLHPAPYPNDGLPMGLR